MTIGTARFLYDNLIDTATLTPSSTYSAAGLVTAALKNGTGSAFLQPGGVYTGNDEREYVVTIDSVGSGSEVGQSTFKWSQDGGATFVALGVTTSTSFITLSDGVGIRFTGATGNDFVIGDTWYFRAINRFSSDKVHDYNRDTRFRSASAAATFSMVIDNAASVDFNVLTILDHNFTSSATITLEGNATDSWGSPSFSEAVTWASKKLGHYTSSLESYRYARVTVSDTSNSDGYIEIGTLFLGEYMELSRNFSPGLDISIELSKTAAKNRYNITKKRFHNKRQKISASWDFIVDADKTKLETMLDTIANESTESLQPIIFNADYLSPSTELWLMEWDTFPLEALYHANGVTEHAFKFDAVEVARSVEG